MTTKTLACDHASCQTRHCPNCGKLVNPDAPVQRGCVRYHVIWARTMFFCTECGQRLPTLQ